LQRLSVPEILEHQQNRFPLLFVDRIDELIPGESAIGVKNFTYNEWFFPAHFHGDPSVPGFVLIESLVQTFIMTFLSIPEHKGKQTSFVKLNNATFKQKIVPGDQLIIMATLKSFKRGIAIGDASGFVNEELAVSADFVIALPDVLAKFKPASKVDN
jgi:3-hydroxyacyl-[acyl-carrier-protein] dehydratase